MKLAVWGHPEINFVENGMDITETLKNFERAGISIYYPFVWLHGKTCYKSEVVAEQTKEDLLQQIIDEAKKYGIEVHPVIVSFGNTGQEVTKYQGHKAPEKLNEKDWICPTGKENRNYVLKVLKELVNNYDIDGIHLDYVRYPNSSISLEYPCECKDCRTKRRELAGYEVFSKDDLTEPGKLFKELIMRNQAVRNFVIKAKEITDASNMKLTMAARARYFKDALGEGQDWVEWAKEGLIDEVNTMSYNDCFERYQRFVTDHSHLLKDTKAKYFAGIGRSSTLGVITTEEMIEQIKLADEYGADGCTIFHSRALNEKDFNELEKLKGSLFN